MPLGEKADSNALGVVSAGWSPSDVSSRLGPIVVMSFNRPDYLRSTLWSLLQQPSVVDGSREVHLFQDGAVNFFSGERYATDEDIERSVHIFKEVFPGGTAHVSDQNIGIALNFDRAERYVFLERGFPSATFFEDDMVLSPHYVAVLQRFLEFAASPESHGLVGYVAAYGNHRAKLEDQRKRQRDVVSVGHSWGYGVTRSHWLQVREVIDPYIKIVADCDYRRRPKAKVGSVHKSLGLATNALSQDAMKTIATTWLGRARLMPFVCLGKYVGANGVNFTPEAFAKRGYGNEELFPDLPGDFDWPSADRLQAMVDDERKRMQSQCQEAYGDRELPPAPFGTFRAAEHLR
jgi:hypothetical protein